MWVAEDLLEDGVVVDVGELVSLAIFCDAGGAVAAVLVGFADVAEHFRVLFFGHYIVLLLMAKHSAYIYRRRRPSKKALEKLFYIQQKNRDRFYRRILSLLSPWILSLRSRMTEAIGSRMTGEGKSRGQKKEPRSNSPECVKNHFYFNNLYRTTSLPEHLLRQRKCYLKYLLLPEFLSNHCLSLPH